MQILPPPSVLLLFSWKMRNVLKRMKNSFSNFYLSSYHENWLFWVQKWPLLKKSKSEKSDTWFFFRFSTSFMQIWPLFICFILMHASSHAWKRLKRILRNMPLTLKKILKNQPNIYIFNFLFFSKVFRKFRNKKMLTFL